MTSSGLTGDIINYQVIRTRFINFDKPGPLFDKNFNLIGINSQFRLDHNLASKLDPILHCFNSTTNTLELTNTKCLRDWKFFTHRDSGVTFPDATSYQNAMVGYTIPNPLLVAESSAKWPEYPIDDDFSSL